MLLVRGLRNIEHLTVRSTRRAVILLTVVFGALAAGCASTNPKADVAYFPPPPASPRIAHLKSFNRLGELVPLRRSLVDILSGRRFDPQVVAPGGVAYAKGHLYLCDTYAGVVHDWDLGHGKAERIGVSSDAGLARPVAVAVDDRGIIYVADTARAEVIAYQADGTLLRRITPTDREVFRPVALAVAGPKLYVADAATHQVDIFSTEDGQYLLSFGRPGAEPGQFHFPTGIAVAHSGRVLVAEMMNARVQVFDDLHKPILAMGQPGDRYGDMGKPRHLVVGPDGTVFITDSHFARVHLFNERGQLLMLLGGDRDDAGGTPMPVGVVTVEGLPPSTASLVPEGFDARYFVFVANKTGKKRVSLFAVGTNSPG